MSIRIKAWGRLGAAWALLGIAAAGLPVAAADDPAITVQIHTTPTLSGATAEAKVTGGVAPYRYRWTLGAFDHAPVGDDSPFLTVETIKPFSRELIGCVVTDARQRTARAFRHTLPLPPGERGGEIRFFGVGDSLESAGKSVDDPDPAIIAVAAQACEQVMGMPPGGIPWDRCAHPGYTSEEIAKNQAEMLERIRTFGATDVFIRMGLNDHGHAPGATVETIRQVAVAVKEGCPGVQRVWIDPCPSRAEGDDRLWQIAAGCKALANEDWLFYTGDAAHWHQRRAPNHYPDETHPGPDANRALGLARAAAWIVKGPASHPGAGLPSRMGRP